MDPIQIAVGVALNQLHEPVLKPAAISVGDKLIDMFPEYKETLRNLPHAGTCSDDLKQLTAERNTIKVRFDNHSSIDKHVHVLVRYGEHSELKIHDELVWNPNTDNVKYVQVDNSVTSVWVVVPGIFSYYIDRKGSYWTAKRIGYVWSKK